MITKCTSHTYIKMCYLGMYIKRTVVILCPVMMVWWLSDFLGGGACVRAALAAVHTESALVWSLASAPFYVVLQLSDVELQLRFECPAARAKAGEAATDRRASVPLSVRIL